MMRRLLIFLCALSGIWAQTTIRGKVSYEANYVQITCVFTSQTVANNQIVTIIADHSLTKTTNADVKVVYFNGTSSIYSPPAELFTTFVNVYWIDIRSSNVMEIKPNIFANATKLMFFIASNNSIAQIAADAFKGASQIYHIDISMNKITTVSNNAFTNLLNLQFLNLNNNQITTLSVDTFATQPKLYSIEMAYNKIFALDKNTFTNNPALYIVDFKFNNITCLDKDLFRNNSEANRIFFSYNALSVIPNTMFSHLKKLYFLWFDGNVCVNQKFEAAYPYNLPLNTTTVEVGLVNCQTCAQANKLAELAVKTANLKTALENFSVAITGLQVTVADVLKFLNTL